jgi:hypothetical protein
MRKITLLTILVFGLLLTGCSLKDSLDVETGKSDIKNSNINNCVGLGEPVSCPYPRSGEKKECCDGLVKIYSGVVYSAPTGSAGGPSTPERCISLMGAPTICSNCGNGSCEERENPCNCEVDCPFVNKAKAVMD